MRVPQIIGTQAVLGTHVGGGGQMWLQQVGRVVGHMKPDTVSLGLGMAFCKNLLELRRAFSIH